MKLRDWAKKNGVCYQTAWNKFKVGLIPGAYQLDTGTIIVPDHTDFMNRPDHTVIYARVSSFQNKDNLDSQATRLEEFCLTNGWEVKQIIKEIGSGLNEQRPKLLSLLSNSPTRIVVEHKDRLTRFGFTFIEKLCDRIGCEIIVVNSNEEKVDLIEDFVSIITSFYARIYGQKRSKRSTERLIKELELTHG